MVKDIVKADRFFVISTGFQNMRATYAVWVNDCAWQVTDSVASATRFSERDIEQELHSIIEEGYPHAAPVLVEELYHLSEVPRATSTSDSSKGFDIHITWHPIYAFPRMAKDIIRLRTDYAKVRDSISESLEVRKRMATLIEEYTTAGVVFCPRCNAVVDGCVTTPDSFGHVMLHTHYTPSCEGAECEYCGYQRHNKIEHWD